MKEQKSILFGMIFKRLVDEIVLELKLWKYASVLKWTDKK